jgi:serine/threonine-protein kinase
VKRGPLPVERAALFVMQACVAVAEAHARGIVHRDIKPANLFVTKDAKGAPLVKLLDFGISKALEEENDLSLTDTSGVVGTPYFMSPEQVRSAKDVDARTDLWSLGVVLYELVTGALPFNGTNSSSLAAQIAADPPLPISKADVPEALQAVVMRCLEKDPSRRYQTASELARALEPFAGGEGGKWVEQVALASGAEKRAELAETRASERDVGDVAARRTMSLGGVAGEPARAEERGATQGASASDVRSPAPASRRRWIGVASIVAALAVTLTWAAVRKGPSSAASRASASAPTLGSTSIVPPAEVVPSVSVSATAAPPSALPVTSGLPRPQVSTSAPAPTLRPPRRPTATTPDDPLKIEIK